MNKYREALQNSYKNLQHSHIIIQKNNNKIRSLKFID